MSELSPADRRVLSVLQDDADRSRKDMAERAGMSASSFWRRATELQRRGLVRGRVTLLDPIRAGFPVCVLLSVNLKDHDEATQRGFETLIQSTPEVMECFSVTGGFDYVMIIRTPTIQAFEALLMKRILGHSSVDSASSQIALRQHKYTTALPL